MATRILETAHNPFGGEVRFWLVSSLIGETIHPGELGSFDPNDPSGAIRRAKEEAARKLGILPEEIVTARSLVRYERPPRVDGG